MAVENLMNMFESVPAVNQSAANKHHSISVGIPTKNRYDVLSHCLLSLAFQTYKPLEIIIVDDSPNPRDLRDISHYEYIFKLFDEKGIKWQVVFGKKKGQHHSHQMVQEMAKGDLVFRIDDDCVAEPDCLQKLVNHMQDDKVGAVAPLVLPENPPWLSENFGTNSIKDLNRPNIQWYKWKGIRTKEADHLYSCFLYRKNIAKYDLTLSNKAHREETIFTYSIKRAGFKLLIEGMAKVWHFRQKTGGIRSDNNEADYHHDEGIFQAYLSLWDVKSDDKKMVVLDSGIGDHWAFKNILPELKQKHKKICIAACFPDVFWDMPEIELISIADAKMMYGDITPFQVYKLLWQRNDEGKKMHLIDGFKELYL